MKSARKKRQPKLKQDWNQKDKHDPHVPNKVLKKFVGKLDLPKEFGHKIKVQNIESNIVGTHVVGDKKIPIFRIDVWVDWWTYDMQQFPSSRIGRSYYQAYDSDTEKFYNLDKSTSDCFEKFYAETKRKK